VAEGGTALESGIKKVTSAGTAVRLPTSGGTLKAVLIYALATNEGTVVVGDSEAKAAEGTHAAPTRRGVALVAGGTLVLECEDSAQIWIDATTSGDGVSFLSLLA
jgi:hypothetical protein